jgi:hypothetical protein
LGIRGQPEAPSTPKGKPRFEVRGHPKFTAYLEELRSSKRNEDVKLLKRINEAISLLQEKPKTGEDVPRDRWPREYRRKYPDLPNLHRYRLDDVHRMLYSIIKTPDLPLFVWIIEAMDYHRYRRLFGYD